MTNRLRQEHALLWIDLWERKSWDRKLRRAEELETRRKMKRSWRTGTKKNHRDWAIETRKVKRVD